MSDDLHYRPMFDASVKLPEVQARVRAWIEALRSGKYGQGKSELRVAKNKFCCLGVLCDLENPDAWSHPRGGGWIWRWENAPEGDRHDARYAVLPPSPLMRERYGMPYAQQFGEGNALDLMNDGGKTFTEIADVIERELTEALARE